MGDDLEHLVSAARRRLVRSRLEQRLGAALRLALLPAVVLVAADRLWRLRFEPWYVIGAALAVAVVAGLTLGLRRRPDPVTAAAELDARLGLKERLSSAVALRGQAGDDALVARLVEDATRHAAGIDLRRVLPWALAHETRACAVLLLMLIGVTLLPRFTFWRSEADLAIEMVTREVGRELSELGREVERQAEQVGAERARQEARKLVREALRLRRARMSKDESLRQLEQLSQRLQQAREEVAGHPLERSAETARRDLRSVEGPLGEVGRQLEADKPDAAAALLKELARKARQGDLTESERQQLAEQARQAAEALRDSPYQAQSEALEKAAEALEKGGQTAQQAAEALEQAAEACEQGGSADEELLRDLQEYCENGKDACGDCEGLRREAERQGGQCPGGLCEGSGPGGGDVSRGPGSTNEDAGQGPPADSARQQPYRDGDSPDDPGAATYEELYAPRRTETLQQDQRTGAMVGSSGRYTAQQGPREAPKLQDSRVPYYEVLDDYEAAADEALSQGDIPATQRQRVKEYFETLREPEVGDGGGGG